MNTSLSTRTKVDLSTNSREVLFYELSHKSSNQFVLKLT